jgi:hypothetical protein
MLRRLLLLSLLLPPLVGCQSTNREPPPAYAFSTPEEGFSSMLQSLRANDIPKVEMMLGLRTEEIRSGDAVSDRFDRANFLKLAAQSWRVRRVTDTAAWVDCGPDDWTFPVPLIASGKTWSFDGDWGREEIITRIAGRNEISTIETLRGLFHAQSRYKKLDPDQDGVPTYAIRIFSTPGKRDGLYWPPSKGAPASPVHPMAAAAEAEGYRDLESGRLPYHGYHFRVLHAQGKNAPGGKRSFSDEAGHLTGGFAFIAWPAEYGRSGMLTFIVNDQGVLFEKDLGRRTESTVRRIRAYDPDDSWTRVENFKS